MAVPVPESRLDGLAAAAPRKITDEQVEVVITRTPTEKGRGQDTPWPTRSMARDRHEPDRGLAIMSSLLPDIVSYISTVACKPPPATTDSASIAGSQRVA